MSMINSDGLVDLPGVSGYELSDLKAIVHFPIIMVDPDTQEHIYPEGYTPERHAAVVDSAEFQFLFKIAAKSYILLLKQQEEHLKENTQTIEEKVKSLPEIYKKYDKIIDQRIQALKSNINEEEQGGKADARLRELGYISVLLRVIHIFQDPSILAVEIPYQMTTVVNKLTKKTKNLVTRCIVN